jgi:hypothetical protein
MAKPRLREALQNMVPRLSGAKSEDDLKNLLTLSLLTHSGWRLM